MNRKFTQFKIYVSGSSMNQQSIFFISRNIYISCLQNAHKSQRKICEKNFKEHRIARAYTITAEVL